MSTAENFDTVQVRQLEIRIINGYVVSIAPYLFLFF